MSLQRGYNPPLPLPPLIERGDGNLALDLPKPHASSNDCNRSGMLTLAEPSSKKVGDRGGQQGSESPNSRNTSVIVMAACGAAGFSINPPLGQ